MSLKTTTDDAQCYLGNIQELLNDLEGEVFTAKGDVVEFDLKKGGKLLQILWDQGRESLLECEGKQMVVKYPDGIAGSVLELAFSFIGFNLQAPVAIDSPELVPDHIKQQIIEEANRNS